MKKFSLFIFKSCTQDMEPGEIGALLRHPAAGSNVAACLAAFPALQMEAHLQPITRRALLHALCFTAGHHSARNKCAERRSCM